MNRTVERIKCEYCEGFNDSSALKYCHCGAALESVSQAASDLEAKKNQARELLKQAAQQFEQAGKNFGEARKHFENARASLKQTEIDPE